ncbi:hypothetical protein ACFLZX_05605 [Nanoarchaeota archaeon]
MESLYKQEYDISNIQENVEMVVYSSVCFFIPFLMGHPQLLVGTLVNASLILGSLNLKSHKLLPVIILPSIGVLSKGAIFGPFTIFLLYMVPFIWIGNFILVFAFKKFNLQLKLNKWLTLLIGAAMKTAFLFIIALVLVKLDILPPIFTTTMGLFQFYTAILGGILALGIHGLKKKGLEKYK